jgi:hypothetical protein
MQIDFHHAVTYVATRLGGLSHEDASTVAHAAQYVDDATTDGPLTFTTGERYVRVTSAHKTFDIKDNADHANNRLVWVPFHFLPGNEAPPAGCDAGEAFLRRMMCKPDSAVARAMILDCIERKSLPSAALPTGTLTELKQGLQARKEVRQRERDHLTLSLTGISPVTPSAGFWKDLATDDRGAVALDRLQMVVWTILLGGLFLHSVLVYVTMPDFSTTLLALMGVSSGTYIGFKMPQART